MWIPRLGLHRPYKIFTPKQADKVNDWLLARSRDYGGGWAILKGVHRPSEPYRIQPGTRLTGSGHPTMYSKTFTRIEPLFEGLPVFIFTDGVDFGNRQAWGGSTVEYLQVHARTQGLSLVQLTGGNGSQFNGVHTTKGDHPFESGIVASGGRPDRGDGQYSTFDRVRMTRVVNGVQWLKNAPDCVISRSMFYGADIRGSQALVVHGNNLTVEESHFQFYDRGLYINAREFELHGGSWENHTGQQQWAQYAVALGPKTRDMTMRSLSLANLSSLDRVFDFDPAAHRFTFDLLSGHVGPDDVPAGYEQHFRWHQG